MKAINNYVIFEPIEEKEEKKSIIILAEEEKPKKYKGLVISKGDKVTKIKENDIILIPRYADEFAVEGRTYMVAKEEDICAIF